MEQEGEGGNNNRKRFSWEYFLRKLFVRKNLYLSQCLVFFSNGALYSIGEFRAENRIYCLKLSIKWNIYSRRDFGMG